MSQASPEPTWYGRVLYYALLSADYPPIVRYISGAFIFLGLFFILPVAFLIVLDLFLWLWRLYWNRQLPTVNNVYRNMAEQTSLDAHTNPGVGAGESSSSGVDIDVRGSGVKDRSDPSTREPNS